MEKYHAIALTCLRPQLTPQQLLQLYEAAGSASEVVNNVAHLRDLLPELTPEFSKRLAAGMDEALRRAAVEMEFCQKHEISPLVPTDSEYPNRLRNCDDAPLVLYYRGTADLNTTRVICIIGTRKCTNYGQDLIRKFVGELKELCPDTLIVSGLAYGVDIHAHRNALANGMNTVGVLAHGLDMIYPTVHREDAKRMLSHGGILTEYPSATRIDKRNFLQRNRIVAGLSDACILPESAEHGGGLVTCRLSQEYGRQVFAFPGAVNAEFSKGCNQLIRTNRAQLITSAADFVDEMGWRNEAIAAEARRQGIERTLFPDLTPDETTIVNALREGGDQVPDQLVGSTSLPISTIKATLFLMEMKGIVRPMAGGFYHFIE